MRTIVNKNPYPNPQPVILFCHICKWWFSKHWSLTFKVRMINFSARAWQQTCARVCWCQVSCVIWIWWQILHINYTPIMHVLNYNLLFQADTWLFRINKSLMYDSYYSDSRYVVLKKIGKMEMLDLSLISSHQLPARRRHPIIRYNGLTRVLCLCSVREEHSNDGKWLEIVIIIIVCWDWDN